MHDVAQICREQVNAWGLLGEVRMNARVGLQALADAEQDRVDDLVTRCEVIRCGALGHVGFRVDRAVGEPVRALLCQYPHSGVGEAHASLGVSGHIASYR